MLYEVITLLHINLTSALFLSDLIEKFKKEGWIIENYSSARDDKVYNEVPSTMPCRWHVPPDYTS